MDLASRACVALLGIAGLATVARAESLRVRLAEEGVESTAVYAAEVFSAPATDDAPTTISGLAALAVELDLAAAADERLGALHLAAFAIHGRGISEQLGDAFGISGNAASPEVRLYEAWYEQPLGRLAVRAGLLSAEEFTVAPHSGGLLDATFGILGSLSYQIGGPVFPVATPGASARVVTDVATFRAGAFDGDQENEHGFPTRLGDDLFAIAELELEKTWKLGGWHHTDKGSAFYAVLDRQLGDELGGFLRLSWSPDDALGLYVDTGIELGALSLGLAFAQIDEGAQTVMEATYAIELTDWLTLQPDLQVLLMRDGSTTVVGARATLSM